APRPIKADGSWSSIVRRRASTISTSIARIIRTVCSTRATCARCRRAKIVCPSPSGPVSGLARATSTSAGVTIRAIVFDFDGVLADTERLHMRATQEALATRGWTLDERAYFDRYLGYGDRDLVLEFARDVGHQIDAALVEQLTGLKAARYRAHLAAGDALFPSAGPCVRRLGDRFARSEEHTSE